MMPRRFLLLAVALLTIAAAPAPGYHVVNTYALGGEGSWDYLAFDTQGHRIFVARQNRIMVVEPLKGASEGTGASVVIGEPD